MKTTIKIAAFGLLIGAPIAQAATVWELALGSNFFDSSSGNTEALTGTITSELILLNSGESFADYRQNITDISILGTSVNFEEASFGGGAIDIRINTGTLHQVQVIIGNPDSSRFGGGSTSYTGPMNAPTSFSFVDLEPFIVGGHDLDAADRLTLELVPVPEPSSIALLGLGGLALVLRRRR